MSVHLKRRGPLQSHDACSSRPPPRNRAVGRAAAILFGSLMCLGLASDPASAYVGPGAGVSLLGAVFGLFSMIALVLWAGVRWLFRSLFRFGRAPSGAVAGVVPAASPSGDSASVPGPAAVPKPPVRGGWSAALQTRLVYLLAGIVIALSFDYPRSLFLSWVAAGDRVISGFADPVVEHHTEPARFGPDSAGVVAYDPSRAFHGLNLELSATEPVVRLLDMQGSEVHRWSVGLGALSRAWAADGDPRYDLSGIYWRRFHPQRDGSMLVIVENRGVTPYGSGLLKLDWQSNVLWMAPRHYHHSVDVGPDDRIYTLYQEVSEDPHPYAGWLSLPYLNEGIAILSPDGVELERIGIIDAFVDTPYDGFLRSIRDDEKGDPLHMNTVRYVTEEMARNAPFARTGDLLVSIRNINTIAVIDPRSRKVTWASSDRWVMQHEPVLTPDGTLLVFDNLGAADARSRAVEWDMTSGRTVWEWVGADGMPLVSWKYGVVAQMPNGNALITESYGGRAIEVSRSGDVVWEWRSDRRYGEAGERIGRLMEMMRLPDDFFVSRIGAVPLRGGIEDAS